MLDKSNRKGISKKKKKKNQHKQKEKEKKIIRKK